MTVFKGSVRHLPLKTFPSPHFNHVHWILSSWSGYWIKVVTLKGFHVNDFLVNQFITFSVLFPPDKMRLLTWWFSAAVRNADRKWRFCIVLILSRLDICVQVPVQAKNVYIDMRMSES